MGRILKQNVVIRPSKTSDPIAFLKGEELPDEYAHLVGEHLFREPGEKKAESVEPKKTGLPSAPKKEVKEDESFEVPGGNASKATWANYADKVGVTYPDDAGREDIKELVFQKYPELRD